VNVTIVIFFLEELANVFCPELLRYIMQFFLNHADVIKSPSLQQQVEFWKKKKGTGL
jgi:hypothetical protein